MSTSSLLERASREVDDYLLAHNLPDIIQALAFSILKHKPVDHVAFSRRWLANLREKMLSLGQRTCRGINLYSIEGNSIQRFASTSACGSASSTPPAAGTSTVDLPATLPPWEGRIAEESTVNPTGPKPATSNETSILSVTTVDSLVSSSPNIVLPPESKLPVLTSGTEASSNSCAAAASGTVAASLSAQQPYPVSKVKKATSSKPKAKLLESLTNLVAQLHKDDIKTVQDFVETVITRRREKQKQELQEIEMLHKFHLHNQQQQQHVQRRSCRQTSTDAEAEETTTVLTDRHILPSAASTGDVGPATVRTIAIPRSSVAPTPLDGAAAAGFGGGVSSSSTAAQSHGHSRRRAAVSATPAAVDSAKRYQVQEVPKSDEERAELMACVEQCSLFTGFDENQKDLVVRAMTKEDFPAGTEILSQGQPGKETFYLVTAGIAEVVKDRRVVAPINPGQYFGELELMYNESACAATVKSVTPVATYGLNKETYQHIILNAALERRALFLAQIAQVGIFSTTLCDYDKMRVAEALVAEDIREGEFLIRCGDAVSTMFIIMDGAVRVVGRDEAGKPVNVIDLDNGHVIGELEFIFHHAAVADVVVISPSCRVAKLNRKHFEMIVGTEVTDAMKEYVASKDIYRHYLQNAQETVKSDIHGAKQRAARRRSVHKQPPTNGKTSEAALAGTLLPEGEVVILSGSELRRFPLAGLSSTKLVIITLLEDGTVQKWNDHAARVTKYKPEQAVGQSIFSFLTSEVEQYQLHLRIGVAREWRGNWEGFMQTKTFRDGPGLFGFTRSDGLVKTQLSLTILPSVDVSGRSAGSLLVVGTEVKATPSTSAVDLGRWLSNKLQPKLRRAHVMCTALADTGVAPGTVQSSKRVVQVISSCEKTLEQFVRVASTNVDFLAHDAWHPVSIDAFLQLVVSQVSAAVLEHGNRLVIHIDDAFPRGQVFLDTDLLLKTLTALIDDTNAYCRGIDVTLCADVLAIGGTSFGGGELASVASTACMSRSMWHQSDVSDNASGADDGPLGAGSNSGMTTPTIQRVEEPQLLRLRLVESSSPLTSAENGATAKHGFPRPAVVTAAASATSPGHSVSPALVSPAHGQRGYENEEDEDIGSGLLNDEYGSMPPQRGACLADIRTWVSKMGGVFTSTWEAHATHKARGGNDASSGSAISTPTTNPTIMVQDGGGGGGGALQHVIELPLVFAQGSDTESSGAGDDGRGAGGVSGGDANRTFTTVLVERSAVQRNNICQLLWSRRHAVLPVGTWIEVTKLVESGACDVLVVDPEALRDDPLFRQLDNPFTFLKNATSKLAIIVTSAEGSSMADFQAQMLELSGLSTPLAGAGSSKRRGSDSVFSSFDQAGDGVAVPSRGRVMQLPKPWNMRQLVNTFAKVEALISRYRDEERRIVELRNTFNETKRGAYEVVRLLGRGAFGEVHEVVDELTGGKMAMKTMRLKREADVDALVEEIRTMTQLQHENIIHYFYCEKSSDSELKIFMELAVGGTLQDKIKRTPGGCGLAHAEIVRHLQDLLQGVAYIHEHRYVHCDIKTANALLDAKGRTKLGDFGTARKLKTSQEKIYVMRGTPAYMAPEVMAADEAEQHGYDTKADVWSLGCVALEMATGQPPFFHIEGTQGMGIFKYVSELTETPDLSPLFHCSPLLFQFVKSCLEPRPDRRPSSAELLKFPLFTEVTSDLTMQAEKLVKRAQLLHTLSKFVAFQSQDDDGESGRTVAVGRGALPAAELSCTDVSRGDDEPSGASDDLTETRADWSTDGKIEELAQQGGFFSSSEDEDEDGINSGVPHLTVARGGSTSKSGGDLDIDSDEEE